MSRAMNDKKPRRRRKPPAETLEAIIYYKDKLKFPKVERHGVIVDKDGYVTATVTIDPVTVDRVVVQPERRPLKDVKGLLRDAKRIANGG